MNKSYETIFIADAHLSNEQIESVIGKMTKVITDNGGNIKFIDRWGKRRLAYEIAKKQYGYYIYVRFDAEGTLIKILEREFRLDDNVLRYLSVLVPRVIVENEGDFGKSQLQSLEAEDEHFSREDSDEGLLETDEISDVSGDLNIENIEIVKE